MTTWLLIRLINRSGFTRLGFDVVIRRDTFGRGWNVTIPRERLDTTGLPLIEVAGRSLTFTLFRAWRWARTYRDRPWSGCRVRLPKAKVPTGNQTGTL